MKLSSDEFSNDKLPTRLWKILIGIYESLRAYYITKWQKNW